MAGPTRTVMQLGRPSFRPSLAPDTFFHPPPPSQAISLSLPSSSSSSQSTATTAISYTSRSSMAMSGITSPSSRLANLSSHPALPSTYSSSSLLSPTPAPTPTPNLTLLMSSSIPTTVSQSSPAPIPQHISLVQKRALLHTVWPYVGDDTLVRVAETSTDLSRLVEIWRMASLFDSSSSSSSSSWLTTLQGFASFFSSLSLIGEGGFKKVLFTRTLEGGEEALSVIELDMIRRNRR